MIRASVCGVSVWGPGLQGWDEAVPVLRGRADHVPGASLPAAPAMLSATERRRASPSVRLALALAEAATAMSGFPADTLRNVFGTSNGDGAVVHAILESLAAPGGQVSPTQFHNSVHNAAAGYWAIAAGSRQAVTCLGCHDATFGTALLKGVTEAAVEQAPTLLCVYDLPLPSPLDAVRPTAGAFGVGLVLTPGNWEGAQALLELRCVAGPAKADAMLPEAPSLRRLSDGNPAARSLRLLQALARGVADQSATPLLNGHLQIRVEPCADASRSPR